MAYTLQNTINYAGTLIEYSPQTSGLGQEPAVTIASMVRGTILATPFTWSWNRAEDSTLLVKKNVQDYTLNLTDFGFIEKASLTDSNGQIFEIKDVLNVAPLAKATTPPGRPSAVSALTHIPYTSVNLRFSPVPDADYTLNLTYQKAVTLLGPFFISSCATAIGGNTVYTGIFDAPSFPVGSTASVTGFVANTVNNGLFSVVSATSTTLTLANASGVAETIAAYVSNFNWSPIPDSYNYIYNMLYMGEIFAMVDDARAQLYRQRGAALLLAKAEGLTETQKNVFMQLWLARGVEQTSTILRTQQGNQGRAA